MSRLEAEPGPGRGSARPARGLCGPGSARAQPYAVTQSRLRSQCVILSDAEKRLVEIFISRGRSQRDKYT